MIDINTMIQCDMPYYQSVAEKIVCISALGTEKTDKMLYISILSVFLLFFVIKTPNYYLHFVDFINNLAFPSFELGIGNAGMKSGKCLFRFFDIIYFHGFFYISNK